ncbi:prepilin-type N-terminal cleavage/methylation domain-containing protein [Isachenkonia alkalipeptolytica]|uniref:Prepilin-type N-terminal cleavage/methylation domain-containing protein n=1 Tax=Isachenkonia alkalipeptolytica TaxID=2565777 RepID=A0AA43XJ50_9CLOT|nr:prepilin-type N-terminal cleavage/methylation domain-containing protein [Isachenkonia alkalipeptolytica]NBG87532.1 prepilin-type N-terminal cleavage/methylation domain-containing protein [Isachenkonia alkalipeptolytica]
MMQYLTKKINNRKGFTLIELIVVIAILAILALIALPRLSQFISDAGESADDATAAVIYRAASAYIASNPNLEALDVSEIQKYVDDSTVNVSDAKITPEKDGDKIIGIEKVEYESGAYPDS